MQRVLSFSILSCVLYFGLNMKKNHKIAKTTQLEATVSQKVARQPPIFLPLFWRARLGVTNWDWSRRKKVDVFEFFKFFCKTPWFWGNFQKNLKNTKTSTFFLWLRSQFVTPSLGLQNKGRKSGGCRAIFWDTVASSWVVFVILLFSLIFSPKYKTQESLLKLKTPCIVKYKCLSCPQKKQNSISTNSEEVMIFQKSCPITILTFVVSELLP